MEHSWYDCLFKEYMKIVLFSEVVLLSPAVDFIHCIQKIKVWLFSFFKDMYMYISEDQEFKNFEDESLLFWKKTGIVYGDWYGGPNGDGTFIKWTKFTASEVN